MTAITLRGGASTEDQRLDRLVPTDWEHVEKYPLRALAADARPVRVPVVLGINWYSNFDRPEKVGRTWWIGRGDLGRVRGGHAICARPSGWTDPDSWWAFYDQGVEGACVGFAWSRAMSLLNRKRYAARWLYHEAQRGDEWTGGSYPGATPVYEGTSVRAGGEVLVNQGHRPVTRGVERDVSGFDGIEVYRWATTWDEVREALGVPSRMAGVPLLNSWGADGYPHVVRLTDEAGARTLDEYGEAAIPTDR